MYAILPSRTFWAASFTLWMRRARKSSMLHTMRGGKQTETLNTIGPALWLHGGMRCIKSGLGLFHEFSKLQNRTVQFGNNPNQVHHTFRHVDDMGLNRNMVRSSVINVLKRISNFPVGKPVNRIINVSGDKLQYTVFKRLENGEYIYNIGRIYGI